MGFQAPSAAGLNSTADSGGVPPTSSLDDGTSWAPRLLSVSISSPSTWIALFLCYATVCSTLRFRFEKAMLRRFNYPDRAALARMTNDDAQKILRYIMTCEFPLFYKTSLQFAILKTYGFETMSKLMVANKTFCDPVTAPKRYEDTTIIFGEFSLNPPTSDRCLKAISRMNFLHSQFKAAGRISNADFLYTLSVCVTEPIRFMNLYEWRPLNDMEVCAIGTFWKSIGDAMQIQYKGYLSKDEWKDGIEFAEDITAWAKSYEVEAMKPHSANQAMGQALVNLLTHLVPRAAKPFVTEVLVALMGDRLREAFLYPEPSILAYMAAYGALNFRWLVMRFLTPPRIFPFVYMSDVDPQTGRIQHLDYLVEPWYLKPTLSSRWGPAALLKWSLGGPIPASTGEGYRPQGYLFTEIGPENKSGKGAEMMQSDQERLRKERISGCPFSRH